MARLLFYVDGCPPDSPNEEFPMLARVVPHSPYTTLIPLRSVEACDVVDLIDNTARRLFHQLRRYAPGASLKELARFACYSAASGKNSYARIIEGDGAWGRSLLVHVDPNTYFDNYGTPFSSDIGPLDYTPNAWCDTLSPNSTGKENNLTPATENGLAGEIDESDEIEISLEGFNSDDGLSENFISEDGWLESEAILAALNECKASKSNSSECNILKDLAPVLPSSGLTRRISNSKIHTPVGGRKIFGVALTKEALEGSFPQQPGNIINDERDVPQATPLNTTSASASTSNGIPSFLSRYWSKDKLHQTQRSYTKPNPKKLQKYKLAYLIMVYQDWRNAQILVDRLLDKNVFIAIHVDRDTEAVGIRSLLETYVQNRYPKAQNIHILNNTLGVRWGHSSIVFAQLNGMFALLDLADWDFVINLSEHDYPLRKNWQIHSLLMSGESYLENSTLPLKDPPNWFRIWHYHNPRAHRRRIKSPTWWFPSDNVVEMDRSLPLRVFPCPNWDLSVKNSQWFAASRALVEWLRSSQAFANLLAFMEHSFIPDESIFAILLYNSPYWRKLTTSVNRRMISLKPGNAHPKWLSSAHERWVKHNMRVGNIFVRKINLSEQKDLLVKWIDEEVGLVIDTTVSASGSV
ncbi:core-2/I-branching enzyme-domain-containing protein [Cladochytrium replicatum]|nr:core-2/I-branching enzyme-domain-containing protein [Cladochytrium replicatum]